MKPLASAAGRDARRAILSVFSRRLREEREHRELTQAEAARIVGVSPALWSRLELGESLPSVSTVWLVSQAWDVSADWLLGTAS